MMNRQDTNYINIKSEEGGGGVSNITSLSVDQVGLNEWVFQLQSFFIDEEGAREFNVSQILDMRMGVTKEMQNAEFVKLKTDCQDREVYKQIKKEE